MKCRCYIKLILMLLLSCWVACAYYNTFYHANRSFKQAENSQQKAGREIASPAEKKLYDEAINKASKVLTFYPKSRWVDDALFLIGMSFYHEGEYAKAERKFSELSSGFPNSEFIHQAGYYAAMCQYRLEEYSQVISSLKSLLADPKSKKLKEEIYFTLGEIYFNQKRYDDAIESYQSLVSGFKDSKFLAEAQYKIGESYLQKKDYLLAKEALSQVKTLNPSSDLLFNSILKVSECYYLMGQVSQGIELLDKLAKDERFYQKLPSVKLKMAEGWYLLEKNEEAVKKYEEITTSHPKTEESAIAYYQLGIIHQERLNDLKKAKEMFDKSKDEMPSSAYAKKALEKSADLAKVEEYKKQLTAQDTEDPAKTMFLLAEVYLAQINQPDSALSEYLSLVEHHPQSEYAPKSLYAAAWVLQNIKKDSLAASSIYQRIIKEYPNSDYVKPAYGFSGQIPSREKSYAEEEYLRAEELLLVEGKIDSALALYREIVSNFPRSEYAPKASYAMAWTIENLICPADSSVISAYQEVIDKFPGTECAAAAKLKLGLARKPTPTTLPLQETTPAAAVDTVGVVGDTAKYRMHLAPTPVVYGPFVYPETQRDSGIKGKVVLKIRIDTEGNVTEAEVLGSLSNYDIDEAAKKAALNTLFNPDSFKVDQLDGYFLYQVEVKPYGTDQYDHQLNKRNF